MLQRSAKHHIQWRNHPLSPTSPQLGRELRPAVPLGPQCLGHTGDRPRCRHSPLVQVQADMQSTTGRCKDALISSRNRPKPVDNTTGNEHVDPARVPASCLQRVAGASVLAARRRLSLGWDACCTNELPGAG